MAKTGGAMPPRTDRDNFIRKSLEANPVWHNEIELRDRIVAEGWRDYPDKPTAGFLSLIGLRASLTRLQRAGVKGSRRTRQSAAHYNGEPPTPLVVTTVGTPPVAPTEGWKHCPWCGHKL